MNFKFLLLIIFFLLQFGIFAQTKNDTINEIEEVIIETKRIALPFSEKSHTITIIASDEISQMPAETLDEVLQQVIGVDIRRRGIDGMQSDLYIRGGNFNQVLMLIDGVKMDDLQSGHHTMNGIISLDNIKRIEVIKGAAARIYGQNAMNGAINIVTKKPGQDKTKATVSIGSFENIGVGLGFQKLVENGAIQFHINKQQSEGYRYNTDFENWNAFFKTNLNKYEFLVSYSQRDFGANGFYASPDFKDQYEETQTHLVSLKRMISIHNLKIKTNAYWRRNQDMYLFLRHDPNYYRNLHINNKFGFTADATIANSFGKTAVGIDVNQGYIVSNNLGDHNRFSTTVFLEHRFQLIDNHIDITPGIAYSYFSDFKSFVYPGIDIGYRFSENFKLYANAGYTSRIPTYTNLFYVSSIEQGNPNLKPEKAFTYEGGAYISLDNLHINLAYFNRNATDLIDWTKDSLEDKWEARNFSEINTQGLEIQTDLDFTISDYLQKISFGYTYMDDSIQDENDVLSRYSLNSFKQQLNGQLKTQFLKDLQQHISYRYSERIDGTSYHLIDAAVNLSLTKWKFSIKANNIFNTEYSETNLVPMPKANYMFTSAYTF